MRERLKFLCSVAFFVLGCASVYATGGGGGYNYNLWHTSHIQVTCEPTGAGLVYATTGTDGSTSQCKPAPQLGGNGRTQNTNNYPQLFYIFTKAADATQYKFDHWECTTRVGDILEYNNKRAANVGDTKTDASTSVYVGLSKMGGTNTGNKSDATEDLGIINAVWVAHYVPIHFFDVTVKSNNNSLGSVEVIGPDGDAENKVGDQVTLYARTEDYRTMFRGWKLNGEWVRDNQGNIIRDVPYTFTVTEQNKGEYVAQFEDGYTFLRIKNHNTGHYISSKKYCTQSPGSGSSGLINALAEFELNSNLSSSLDDQGTIARLTNYPRPGSQTQIVQEIEIRGFNTNQFYTVDQGIFLQIFHDTDNTYDIGKGTAVNFHLYEDASGKIVGTASVVSSMNYKWDFEGIDKDLTTKENYYTPGDLIQDANNGLWYTTHRAAWNTMFDTNEIAAYIVTGVDENGELTLVEVTGGIIPAGVPVLLECQSNDVTRNVMIPTLNAATFTATSGNILMSPAHYYPNESAPQSPGSGQSYYGLGVNSAGHVGFVTQVTNTSTGMNGNRGYYLGPSPVVLPTEYPQITLADLLASGDTKIVYEIIDLTAVEVVDNDRLIICKDNNGAASRAAKGDDEIDYMQELSGLQASDYDQSNWVGLRLPDGKEATVANVQANKMLTNVIGRLVSSTNPEVQLENLPEVGAAASSFTPNVYVPASFKGTQTSPVNGNTYFFVQPKPMELATIDWAQWDGEKFASVPMTEDESGRVINQAGLSGGFDFSAAYLVSKDSYTGIDMSSMAAGDVYQFGLALVREKTSSSNLNHVYVLGDVNGMGAWSPSKGVEMFTDDGENYTITVTVDNVDNGVGYFSFTKKLGNAWDDIKDYRFGADCEGANFWVNDEHYNTQLNLQYWSSDSRAFRVPAGKYTLTVNLSTSKLVIRRGSTSSQAPRREGATNGYVVYPLSMTKQGSVVDNVITGVSDVKAARQVMSVTYYDTMGRVSMRPFAGVNIVVTRYNDGTVSTVKRIDR